ncbi:MAG: LysR family transcriptional regulator [Clostridia bacterium]|nr:LysR family transcriptional regulator [Clostridia bacterium]MBQ3014247.1 LysR family transcriptional regulator [Clostridia bacterium]
MNLVHLKYAVEVAKTQSISKAAENLYMGQPNLSRAIKELEDSLGITIFSRTSKGISVTPDGEEFLQYAKRILAQVDQVEEIYRIGKTHKQKLSVCVPRSSYISAAFAEFAKGLSMESPAEIFYKETNSSRTVNNIVKEEYNLGIVRFQTAFERYYQNLFEEKNLEQELLTEFSYVLLVSEQSPLAKKGNVQLRDLADYIEITHGDPYVPSLPMIDVKKAELSEFVDKRIFVFERGSQFELLEKLPFSFMWVSPVPNDILEKYHLVALSCSASAKVYKDVLIYRKGYRPTELDRRFIAVVSGADTES